MAEVVADRLPAAPPSSPSADLSTKLKLLGVDVASFGDALASTDGCARGDAHQRRGKPDATPSWCVSDDAKTLLGGVLVGDASSYGVLRPLVGRRCPATRSR